MRRIVAALVAAFLAVVLFAHPAEGYAPTSLSIGTHNLLHGKAAPHAFADVIGWQEADTRRAHTRIRAMDGYRTYSRTEVPISWRTASWRYQDAGTVRTHKGLSRVSPHRYVTWVRLEHRRTHVVIVLMNTHAVSGAWNQNTGELAESWRRSMWGVHDRAVDRLADRFAAKGYRLFLTGDMNRLRHVYTYTCLRRADAGGIDVILRSTSSRLESREVLPYWGSDHRAERVRVNVH
ncbi:hypothetical protein SAMN05428985_11060 [Nocardioides sp. YR527]|uniref:endonuclease/exonuclease/phosphatase family protein n=1 Tax=Nocardioides sp. YR527 TaxID=1881028 RepID=UPI00088D51AD|nr:endonuclease/exonuclease/phosphatase family protein [Nocardioides sp. YR527]SDL14901.1 hypothetical protein SAMN05428985_11060 [Nocardioides sp. YR527]